MEDGIKNNNNMISELNNNIFNKHITNIPIGKKLRVHSTKAPGNSIFWGIAFVQGASSIAAACAVVQGYGTGSSARYHITPILSSSYILWEYGKDGDMDFLLLITVLILLISHSMNSIKMGLNLLYLILK